MAFLDGIFSRKQTETTPAAQPNVALPNQQQVQTGTQPGNGTGGPATKAVGQPPANSNAQLDGFMSLLTPKPAAPGAKKEEPQGIFGNIDPAKLQEQVKAAKFVDGIDQTRVQAALGGDSAAFMEVLNTVAQNAFAANMNLTRGMVEHGVNTGRTQIESGLDSRFRDYQVRTHNSNVDNPALQHPVGKAMLASVTQQIANANPQMHPTEVTRLAEQNFLEFMKLGGQPNQSQDTKSSGPKETNWLNYLDEPQVESDRR